MRCTADIQRLTSSVLTQKQWVVATANLAIQGLGSEFEKNAQDNLVMNGSYITGNLYDSITVDYLDDGLSFFAVIYPHEEFFVNSGLNYSGFVEYGRGPVFPITKKALHWIDPFTGLDVFAKSVKASQPKPFMEPALVQTAANASSILDTYFA